MFFFFCKNMEITIISKGLSLENQVDGLPGASHRTEAVWALHGSFWPAPIATLDKEKIENVLNRTLNCPKVLFKLKKNMYATYGRSNIRNYQQIDDLYPGADVYGSVNK